MSTQRKQRTARKSGKAPSKIKLIAQEERMSIQERVTASIITALEAGDIPWLCPWSKGKAGQFGADGMMPRNAVSGRCYSGVNVFLLWATAAKAGYSRNLWLTYRQAQELGGNVRKGEKSTLVIFNQPMLSKQKNDDGSETTKKWWLQKGHWLFNVCQCDGLDLSKLKAIEAAKGLHDDADWLAFLDSTGASIRHGGDRAYYSPPLDYVQMPDARAFVDVDAYRAVLCHELTHWSGHTSRLDRKLSGSFATKDYAFEELVAELGAAYTCAALGVELVELRHASYVQSWIRHLKDDPKAIMRAASLASKASDFLLSKYTPGEMPKGRAVVVYKEPPVPAVIYPTIAA